MLNRYHGCEVRELSPEAPLDDLLPVVQSSDSCVARRPRSVIVDGMPMDIKTRCSRRVRIWPYDTHPVYFQQSGKRVLRPAKDFSRLLRSCELLNEHREPCWLLALLL